MCSAKASLGTAIRSVRRSRCLSMSRAANKSLANDSLELARQSPELSWERANYPMMLARALAFFSTMGVEPSVEFAPGEAVNCRR